MKTLETTRLIIEKITAGDAPFVLAMLNDDDFIHYVADRGVRTIEQAQTYISDRIAASYKKHGVGMAAVRLKNSGETIGMCGLVKRDNLSDIDLGYGFLPAGRGQGYAYEAAVAVMEWSKQDLALSLLAAIIHPENTASRNLATKIGMSLDSMIRLTPDDDETCLYLWSA